ncbi:Holliday junction resolvase RuvX [Chloroflexota bacterium]
MRILGLDVGEKRIGVALSDPLGLLASALTTIEVKTINGALVQIAHFATEYEVENIVVGLPHSLDGSVGKQAQKVLGFIELLSQHTNVPIITCDERFSTITAEHVLVESGAKKAKRKKHLDAVAAAIILQSHLDQERNNALSQN